MASMVQKVRFVAVVVVVLLWRCDLAASTSFWEFFIGPSLDEDAVARPKNTETIVRSYGYRLDTHLVASETGHILTLHRIPMGRHESGNRTREVALIHHGLFGCSDMWLLRGPLHDLPYILADLGYDVWLYNGRGNVYSRKHKFLDPDKDPQYWNFGIEEMGNYDLPATIDYILNVTKTEKLFFLGHSIGSSAGLITLSMHPEYNERIKLFIALGPLANVKHRLNSWHKTVLMTTKGIMGLAHASNIHELLPRRPYFSKIVEVLCEDGSPLQRLCLKAIFSIVGDDLPEFNTTTFPEFVNYYPSGTSMKVMTDVLQYYLSGEFARSDFGTAEINEIHYKNTTPPLYDLSRVKVPVSLHYGEGDFLVTKEDIDDLGSKLGNIVGKFKVPHFNHLDFVLAMNARELLYNKLIRMMNEYQ